MRISLVEHKLIKFSTIHQEFRTLCTPWLAGKLPTIPHLFSTLRRKRKCEETEEDMLPREQDFPAVDYS